MKKKIALLLAALMLLSTVTACGAGGAGEASVQSVSMICGLGATGLVDRFAGMVTPQGETKLKKSDSTEVAEIMVAVGDSVTKDQVLFTYDMTQARLDLEKARLELEQLKNNLQSRKEEKEQLERDKDMAGSEQQLDYSLEIREVEAAIQEANYNITLKGKDIEKLQASLANTSVKSPCDGRVQAINEYGGSDEMGNELPFMTIVQTDGYRVKGYVNEANAYALTEGAPVIARSRVNDQVWHGTITMIEWDNPMQNSNYYGDTDTVMSSKYPFYVELESSDGLLLGQHVYIEPDNGQETEPASDAINLPEWYIVDADSNPFVWAQGKNGKLEKRSVTLGDYDEMMGTYPVLEGLTADDYIAFPDDSLKAGMTCVTYDEGTFTPDEGMYDEGMMGGEMMTDDMLTDDMLTDDVTDIPEDVPVEDADAAEAGV